MTRGLITKALSGFYYVDTGTETVECRAPGRFRREKITPLVGDIAELEPLGGGKGVLRAICERKNFFLRPAIANIDQMIICASAAIPETDPFLIDRVAAIAQSRNCEQVVCINKCDLERGDGLFDIYAMSGFKTLQVSAETGEGIEGLRGLLSGNTSVFTGNSGVGKSSILNCLDSGLDIKTDEVSKKLGRGRHTTRHVELFRLDDKALVADTPGFSSFDSEQAELKTPENIQHYFREFEPYISSCRYTGCSHVKEAGCAVLEALSKGEIHSSRHKSYVRLYESAMEINSWER